MNTVDYYYTEGKTQIGELLTEVCERYKLDMKRTAFFHVRDHSCEYDYELFHSDKSTVDFFCIRNGEKIYVEHPLQTVTLTDNMLNQTLLNLKRMDRI